MKMLVLLLAVSCAHWSPVNRSDYVLLKQDGFLVSNIYVNPTDLDVNKKTINFDYNIVVKNLAAAERKLSFKEAKITIGLRVLPIRCRTFEKEEEETVLRPGETMTVVCKIALDKQEGMFQIGDYKSLIELPLDQSVMKFAYLLRAEDFQ